MVNTDSSVYFTLEYETIYMRVSAEGALEILTEWGKSHLKAPWQTVHTVLMYLVLDSWAVSCDKNLSQPRNPIYALAPTHTSACSCTTYRGHDERMCGFPSFISCQKDVTVSFLWGWKRRSSLMCAHSNHRVCHMHRWIHTLTHSPFVSYTHSHALAVLQSCKTG